MSDLESNSSLRYIVNLNYVGESFYFLSSSDSVDENPVFVQKSRESELHSNLSAHKDILEHLQTLKNPEALSGFLQKLKKNELTLLINAFRSVSKARVNTSALQSRKLLTYLDVNRSLLRFKHSNRN